MTIKAIQIDLGSEKISLWQLSQKVEEGCANAFHVEDALRQVSLQSPIHSSVYDLTNAVRGLRPLGMLDETLGGMMASAAIISQRVSSDGISSAESLKRSLNKIMEAKGIVPKTIIFEPSNK